MSEGVLVTLVDRPTRGTRPANRRELILAAATELFATRGYEHVTISDVADAVAVGPSALYRHFSCKEVLLGRVVDGVIDRFDALLDGSVPAGGLASAMSTFALDHRSAGVLWEREARHLPPQVAATARARLRESRTRLSAEVGAIRPELPSQDAELVAAAMLAAAVSPSFHHARLPRPAFDALLAGLLDRVLAAELPPRPDGPDGSDAAASASVSGLARSSKRELLLGAATRLFAERTYASVSMEEVAAEVGLSASTVYHHFASKLDVLVTLLTRGSAYLQVALDEVLATAAGPAEALRGLVTSYGRFAVAHPQLVDILITEARTMPEKEAAAMVETQRDYVSEWVHLLRQFHGGVDDTTARVQVQAALMVMNNLARHPSLRGRPGADRVLSSLADRVLDLT